MTRDRKRVLILSSFPPTICGIAQYADAQARMLEAEGAVVERVDIESARGPFRDARGAAHLFRVAREADEVWAHYQVTFYTAPKLRPMEARVATAHGIAAIALTLARRSFLVVHETEVAPWPRSRRLQRAAAMTLFRAADTLCFHTERERRAFNDAFFTPRDARVIGAGAFYRRRISFDRAAARAKLGIDDGRLLLVCIGFFHEGKGFTEFAQHFAAARDRGVLPAHAELAVVTSVRPASEAEQRAPFERMRATIAGLRGVRLVDSYVSDDEFDTWLVAADRVVAPYRWGFTSSIVARAAVYGVPALMSAAGFLSEQKRDDDIVYRDADELTRAFNVIASAR